MIWRNGWIGKWTLGGMDASEHLVDLPVPSTKNYHTPKMDVLSTNFLQIILAAKCIAGHSSTSPNQQRRPLPSLLYKSFFYGDHIQYTWYGHCSLLYLKYSVLWPCGVSMSSSSVMWRPWKYSAGRSSFIRSYRFAELKQDFSIKKWSKELRIRINFAVHGVTSKHVPDLDF